MTGHAAMWAASGAKAALPSAVTTPQLTLIGIGGKDGWHLYQPQVLQALGGCARQLFDLSFRYPRKATGEEAWHATVAAADAELAAKLRCQNWRGGLIEPPADESTPEGREMNQALEALQGYAPNSREKRERAREARCRSVCPESSVWLIRPS